MDQRIRRERMVARHLETRGIVDGRVLAAMRAIPRECFVEDALADKAYGDHALPIGYGQTLSQPWVVARLAQLLELTGAETVLEIGTGSGYQAAVLSRLAARVFTVERIPELSERAQRTLRSLGIENVHLKVFDGTYGWSEFAPYGGVVVTAASPEVPAPLVEQLATAGRLVLPLGERGGQVLRRVTRLGAGKEELRHEDDQPVSFVPLIGRYGFAERR